MLVRIAMIAAIGGLVVGSLCWAMVLLSRRPGVPARRAVTRGWDDSSLYTAAGLRYRRGVIVAVGVSMAGGVLLVSQLLAKF